MTEELLKVGDVATRTGLSVRALHHYDEIGLLSPGRRTRAGHRLYAGGDVARLLRIRSLQQLGLPLDEIGRCLDDPEFAPLAVLDRHIAALRERAAEAERLRSRLEALRERLSGDGEVPVGQFLDAIEEMTMFEKYYSKEQLAQLQARAEALGEDTIRAAEAEWPRLIAAMRDKMAAGAPPDDPEVMALARRWDELIEQFTGGDDGIRESLANLYRGEPQVAEERGLDGGLGDYVRRVRRE
ncbi:MAG: TipAS antibiotic-recognition domain-containing protein [bacterium]|nr:TipAS antibiotic-recognition domain-containing protein [bacterium]